MEDKLFRKSMDDRYKNNADPTIQWMNLENQRARVWQQNELFPQFMKKYGRINETLMYGHKYMEINIIPLSKVKNSAYIFVIDNNWFPNGPNSNNIEKSIVISNALSFGSDNNVLTIMCIIATAFCAILTMLSGCKRTEKNENYEKYEEVEYDDFEEKYLRPKENPLNE